jgi:hypothetical protein
VAVNRIGSFAANYRAPASGDVVRPESPDEVNETGDETTVSFGHVLHSLTGRNIADRALPCLSAVPLGSHHRATARAPRRQRASVAASAAECQAVQSMPL